MINHKQYFLYHIYSVTLSKIKNDKITYRNLQKSLKSLRRNSLKGYAEMVIHE